MERKKISVIIPVYNVAPYLTRCLDSVVGQTYQNLEIILVDDGSTDGSGAICDGCASRDSRITVIHQKNQGLSAARNAGLERMAGELVGFVDSDDWIEPDFYELLERKMEDTQADIVTTGYYYTYRDKEIRCRMPAGSVTYLGQEGLRALSRGELYHVVWNKLYRRELFAGLPFAEGRTYEDVLISYRLLLRAKRVESQEAYGYHQTMRQSSISHHPGSAAEDFMAQYELWQEMRRMGKRGQVPEDIVRNFFADTALWAHRTLYQDFSLTRAAQPEFFRQAKRFWESNRGQIAGLDRKLWLAVHFPFLFRAKAWVREKLPGLWELLRRCRRPLRGKREFFD